MASSDLISKDIDQFYAKTSEENRLSLGLGPLEYERNTELIGRYLSTSGKDTIIDVGGGPGIYAEWLAQLGHMVYLIDPVAKHIKQAKLRASKLKKPFQCLLGESRNLDIPSGTADVVILHGPLYHLQSKQDRIISVKEALRVLKPGGTVLGFAINYTASTIAGLLNGMIHETSFYEMCKKELQTGIHNPPQNWPGLLPEAYFHKPEELKNEFETGGFTALDMMAVEGMIWLDSKYFETRSTPAKKEAIMALLKMTERDPSILSMSPHMMIAGRKN
ncbi:class I SAM-dependent methyltransferase [Pedobacter sp.]|jgi:ubiquinone/menaquinone biosynthesis C-methylase UbiE|uniref:class I SAM-dependent methyltransferase n=1 Tax=Pedobacter sp. TaxID=1411316 RepID=UPI002B8688D8|nr:methyltransferase domain-containing protein [Pedobacter sp.]HWW37770.1 methyltransferase domain-containing protein [Pedobacter sp.]